MKNTKLSTPIVNILSSGTILNGDITTEGDFRIEGSLEGSIKCNGRLSIGLNAKIIGNIECDVVEILGDVKGVIVASDSITFKGTSKFNGEIKTPNLSVEFGSVIVMKCNI